MYKRYCDLKKVDIVKIDVEGVEVDVLKAADKFLKKYKLKLAIEVHGKERLRILIRYLVNASYTMKVLKVGKVIRFMGEGDLYYLYIIPLRSKR